VRQIGTAQDVYDEPADTFVGAFLGSPPMNLVERDDHILGFRPEQFFPREAFGHAARVVSLPFRVTRVEYLGADRLLYGILGSPFPEAKVVAKLPWTITAPVEPGGRYSFAVHEKELKFFDKVTGLRTGPRPI